MNNTITKLTQHTIPEMAEVVSIDQKGRILAVRWLELYEIIGVVAQAKHISKAEVGDHVLVQNTKQGVIVTCLLATQSEPPAANIKDNDGHIQITAAKSVTISTKKGSIEVNQDGQIYLDAKLITADSENDLTLSGWPVRLN
ncbi:hypothetical protein [Flocculibacter collagenilyticus]|uniref:hypothetical protein n=1 Tax=Flocculibacter collagenilyticus TaxID=2744479 RepID=UPI0018F59D2B|nr:hypothetical protein [Flocculibacter collagenilyticus]